MSKAAVSSGSATTPGSGAMHGSGAIPGAIAAIVLAAGSSTRFGANKLLHPLTLHGVTLPLAAHSLLPWLEIFSHITVVVRPQPAVFCKAMETALGADKAAAIRWVECATATQGMAASLACGVGANLNAAGWLIGLADMPAISSAVIGDVRKALLQGGKLAVPYYEGQRGHPVGFAAHYRDELLTLTGDQGARNLLQRDSANVARIDGCNKGIVVDIDQPGDLLAL